MAKSLRNGDAALKVGPAGALSFGRKALLGRNVGLAPVVWACVLKGLRDRVDAPPAVSVFLANDVKVLCGVRWVVVVVVAGRVKLAGLVKDDESSVRFPKGLLERPFVLSPLFSLEAKEKGFFVSAVIVHHFHI